MIAYLLQIIYFRKSIDDVPPSSPEFDDVKSQFSSYLLRILPYTSEPPVEQVPSPTIPIQVAPSRGTLN